MTTRPVQLQNRCAGLTNNDDGDHDDDDDGDDDDDDADTNDIDNVDKTMDQTQTLT